MIGVIAKPGQEGVAEEFFELFKTPWEWYRPGRQYDVILATADEVPEVNSKLLLLFGADPKKMDTRIGLTVREHQHHAILTGREGSFPVYGRFLTFTTGAGVPCVKGELGTTGIKFKWADSTVIRLGYDLFEQVRFLLSEGQPLENAQFPTLDMHIRMLREWILEAGIAFVEIPPVPYGRSFSVCLTHDIDFVGIKNHFCDRTMLGFLYRATLGALGNFRRGRISAKQLFQSWWAAATLPLVYLGLKKDFWEPFEWYKNVEKGIPATYFLIPFKGRAGERVPGPRASLRAAGYDLRDLASQADALKKEGCEIGVHGIDAWHDPAKGREELGRIKTLAGDCSGIRMHWLLRDDKTPSVLEEAGFAYDSTSGYNDTVGYRAGTSQVFSPNGAHSLLELPMHIQDGALFYRQKLDLSQAEAKKLCQAVIDHARIFGGVLTLLWHDRSHAPERFWGDFYSRLVQQLKTEAVWFATAGQTVAWFRKRRQIQFRSEGVDFTSGPQVHYNGDEIQPPVTLRIYRPKDDATGSSQHIPQFTDLLWNGSPGMELDLDPGHAVLSDSTICSLS